MWKSVNGDRRERANWRCQHLSIAQFLLAFFMLFFASYSVNIHGSYVQNGVPYYAGAYIASVGVLLQSFIGASIFDTSTKSTTENIARKEAKLAMKIYIASIPVGFILTVIGATLTSLYGVNIEADKRSYTQQLDFNIGLAGTLLTMELLSVMSMCTSVWFSYKYARCFGVTWAGWCGTGHLQIKGIQAVVPILGVDEERDIYHLEKWEQEMDRDTYTNIDVKKVKKIVKEARDNSRPNLYFPTIDN